MSTRMVWPQIDPGKLVHKITLLAEEEVVDISGTVTKYVPWLVTWAEILPVRGTDVIKGGQATTTLYLTVTIRWQDGVLPDMQIQTDNGNNYIIQSVENPGERNILLVLNCVALAHNE
jgi:SPP1 family predicted phage head-tail adaptor